MWYGDYLPTVIPQTVGTHCVQDVDPADRGPIGLTVEKWDNADILTMSLGFPNVPLASPGHQREMEDTL